MFLFVELEEIRAKMESYKQLYDAGDSLPAGTVYKLCPFYLMKNPVYLAKAVPWMMEYNIPGTVSLDFSLILLDMFIVDSAGLHEVLLTVQFITCIL